MTAKNYLAQARSIENKIDALKARQSFLRTIVADETISLQLSDMPKPATRNIRKNENAIMRILEVEDAINELRTTAGEIEQTIGSVRDSNLQQLLTMRYLKQKSWKEIANELMFSRSHVFKLHNIALAEVEKMILK
jgi:DNA-directed RNA polymerase specialized sigma subunit